VVINDHDDYIAYADRATLVRDGDTARLRDLIDLKAPGRSPDGLEHQSSLAESEFDCLLPRMRTLALALHAGPMGAGEVVKSNAPPAGWLPVSGGTLLDLLRRYACE
jgi:hypothetical protein